MLQLLCRRLLFTEVLEGKKTEGTNIKLFPDFILLVIAQLL